MELESVYLEPAMLLTRLGLAVPPIVVVPNVTGLQVGVAVGVKQPVVLPVIYCKLLEAPVAAVKP